MLASETFGECFVTKILGREFSPLQRVRVRRPVPSSFENVLERVSNLGDDVRAPFGCDAFRRKSAPRRYDEAQRAVALRLKTECLLRDYR